MSLLTQCLKNSYPNSDILVWAKFHYLRCHYDDTTIVTNNLISETKLNSDTFTFIHTIIIKFFITWSDSSCISRLCRLWSFGEFSCVSDSSLSAIPESCDFPFERELWRLLSTDAARRERSARVFKRLRLRGGSPKLATRLKKKIK